MMAETFRLELVAPEQLVLQTAAEMVVVPGVEGLFGAMPRHAPVISALRPGILAVHGSGSIEEYVVTGGFAEVAGDRVRILVDEAIPRAQFRRDDWEKRVRAAVKENAKERVSSLQELERYLS